MNQRLFRDTAILFLIIGILDFFANKFYLYWTTWWFDMFLHFLSGGVVAMTVILFWLLFFKVLSKRGLWTAVLCALIIGILWEVFEIYFDITSFADGLVYWTDTTLDIILDVLGGFLGMKYSLKVLNKNV